MANRVRECWEQRKRNLRAAHWHDVEGMTIPQTAVKCSVSVAHDRVSGPFARSYWDPRANAFRCRLLEMSAENGNDRRR